jgi:hypothetical protein
MATLAGSMMLPGMLGRAVGAMDPFSAGMGGFIRGAGLGANVTSEMGLMARMGSYAKTAGSIGTSGLGNIARAGIGGLGTAAVSMLPALAIGGAIQYGAGKMIEGAQYQNQVGGFLQQNFRHTNAGAEGGFGFAKSERAQISSVMETMGNREMMSSPQEMRRIMEKGVGMGQFSAVQDAKEFQKKFKEMVGTLKEVAKTMSTTLEGAMPFLQESKKMGFWTAADITKGAGITKGAAINSGLSVEQTQQMMSQGSSMARSVGAQGITGAQGMAQTLNLVGGGMRSGVLSAQQMSEATGGLQGAEAAASLSGTLQSATTRFASGGRARWLLAAMANKNMTGLDAGKMSMMASGAYSLGDVRSMAEGNVSGRGAEFVMGEKQMRGDLIKQGPMAQLGLVRMLGGARLFGKSGTDKLITQRMMERYFGVGGKQAEAMAELARNLPQIMKENQQRTETQMDQETRNREEMLNHSMEGMKKKIGDWWSSKVSDPLNKMGAKMSSDLSTFVDRVGNKMFGVADTGFSYQGASNQAMKAMQLSALGDAKAFTKAFGSGASSERTIDSSRASALGVEKKTFGSAAERKAAIESGQFTAVEGSSLKAVETASISRKEAQYRAASTGRVTDETAKALGLGSKEEADKLLQGAREEMKSGSVQMFLSSMADQGRTGKSAQAGLYGAIKRGEVGGDKLKELIRGGSADARMRLATASQGDEDLKGRHGALALDEDQLKAGNAEPRDFVKAARARQDKMEDVIMKMGMTAAGGKPVGGQEDVHGKGRAAGLSLRALWDDPNIKNEMEAALVEFAPGADGKISPEGEAAGMEKLKQLQSKVKDPAQREAVKKLINATGEERKSLITSMGAMGRLVQEGNADSVAETHQTRMTTLKASLGENRDVILGALSGDLKKGVEELISGGGGPAEIQASLQKITQAASGMDPRDVAEQLSGLRGIAGAGGMLAAADVGSGARATKDAFAKKNNINQQVQMLTGLFGSDAGIDAKSVRRIKAGKGQADIDKILNTIKDPTMRGQAREMLEQGVAKGQAGLDKILSGARTIGGVGAVEAALGRSDQNLKILKAAREGNGTGGRGTQEGIWDTLQAIAQNTKILANEEDGEGYKDPVTAPSEKPKP